MEAMTVRARGAASRAPASFPVLAAGIVTATVAYGLASTALGHDLGTSIAPFAGSWSPRAGPLALPAAVVLAAAVVSAPQLRRDAIPPVRFAAAVLVLGLTLRVALGVARDGVPGLYQVFQLGHFEAASEYVPALPAFDFGTRFFLDTFAQVGPSLPVNAVGHPPGLLVTIHLLGIRSAQGLAAFTIGTGALSIPLAYAVGRRLLDERRARTATLLYVFAPSAVLLGATSADALYATLAMAALFGLLGRRVLLGAAGFAVAAFFSYANLAVGAFATLVAWRRSGVRAAAVVAGACALTLLGPLALLHLGTGYDPLGAIRSAASVYREGIATTRPYAFWLFGSPAAFLVALGPVTAWYALRGVPAGDPAAFALLAVLAVAALLGFTKAETERIYLFLVPLACVAAAATLPERLLPAALWTLAAQALAVELLIYTVW
jgi:methylthioxylose transferase